MISTTSSWPSRATWTSAGSSCRKGPGRRKPCSRPGGSWDGPRTSPGRCWPIPGRSVPFQTLDLHHLVREMVHLLSVSISKKADIRLELADGRPRCGRSGPAPAGDHEPRHQRQRRHPGTGGLHPGHRPGPAADPDELGPPVPGRPWSRPVRGADGGGQRAGHAPDPGPDLRPLLHHQVPGPRTGARRPAGHRQGPPGRDQGRQRTGPGHGVHDPPARHLRPSACPTRNPAGRPTGARAWWWWWTTNRTSGRPRPISCGGSASR